MEKATRRAEKERETSATRFFLDNDGALSLSLGNRRFILTPTETTELRVFLDATGAVISRVKICR
jgi:DNA-binding response OmpR family regulator